nr:conotoxin precursor Q [Conus judaeus]
MSTLGMMLLILLLLLPLAAFDGDGPTSRGHSSDELLNSLNTRECNQEQPCASQKWCCEYCCARSDCECKWVGGLTIKDYECDC